MTEEPFSAVVWCPLHETYDCNHDCRPYFDCYEEDGFRHYTCGRSEEHD